MPNTSRNIFCTAFVLLVSCTQISAACASESKSVNSMPKRLASSTAYGVGIVKWGAVAQSINRRPQLFTYQIGYGTDDTLRICTERELHPGQKVFFAITIGASSKNKSCISDASYLPANQFTQFIYAGFDDLLGGKTWFEIPPGVVERFDCQGVDLVRTSVDARSADGQQRPDIRGVPGIGSYFSDVSLMQCLKLQGLPQYKRRSTGSEGSGVRDTSDRT